MEDLQVTLVVSILKWSNFGWFGGTPVLGNLEMVTGKVWKHRSDRSLRVSYFQQTKQLAENMNIPMWMQQTSP